MYNPGDRVRIGQTDLEVTRLGLGAASIGNLLREVSEEDAQAVFKAAFEAIIHYIDTAPFYGCGLSENLLAQRIYDCCLGGYLGFACVCHEDIEITFYRG